VLDRALAVTERSAIEAIKWLYKVAQTNDGMCRMVCNSLTVPLLLRIIKLDPWLSKPVAAALHNLFLTLMADQSFKMSLAIAYAHGYPTFSKDYGRCAGTQEGAIFGLSVQFLNREMFVAEITEHHRFLQTVCRALKSMLLEARDEQALVDSELLQTADAVIAHKVFALRRYNPLIGDLKVGY
jgi:hypothetical protein